jgi:hypothetical protein
MECIGSIDCGVEHPLDLSWIDKSPSNHGVHGDPDRVSLDSYRIGDAPHNHEHLHSCYHGDDAPPHHICGVHDAHDQPPLTLPTGTHGPFADPFRSHHHGDDVVPLPSLGGDGTMPEHRSLEPPTDYGDDDVEYAYSMPGR